MTSVRIIKLLALAGVVCLMGCRGYCERNYPAVSGQAGCVPCAQQQQQPCCAPASNYPLQPCGPAQTPWTVPAHQ